MAYISDELLERIIALAKAAMLDAPKLLADLEAIKPAERILKEGGKYRMRDGRTATLTCNISGKDTSYPWRGLILGVLHSWAAGGSYWSDSSEDSEFDLMEEIVEAPAYDANIDPYAAPGATATFDLLVRTLMDLEAMADNMYLHSCKTMPSGDRSARLQQLQKVRKLLESLQA